VRRARPQRAPDLLATAHAPLRGEAKLRAALAEFGVRVAGRVCLDLGAAAGGFTRVLLESGAAKVYAVDAGFGQLLGSLRQATNVSALDGEVIPEAIEVVTIDVSYLALAAAVAQLDRITIAPGADLIGLVKPMFELRLARAPVDAETVDAATARAVAGITAAGWEIAGVMPSPVLGGRGAVEALVHGRRSP
jgi:23S rRNA (cytidine1920-2'-O)/16S rRNA (cytidine1409-2'-O)-methyltransferase